MKAILHFFFLLPFHFIIAQNVQLHYDFGKPENEETRNFLVSTIEMFRPDTLGYTFFFIDFEYNSSNNPKGASLGYWEISRELYFPWLKNNKTFSELGMHIEYNDGLNIYIRQTV